METLFTFLVVGLLIEVMLMLIRVYRGPSVYDRLNGTGVIGTDAVLALVILGFLSGREDMYVDIAISYAILGFIGLVVIAKYLQERGDGKV